MENILEIGLLYDPEVDLICVYSGVDSAGQFTLKDYYFLPELPPAIRELVEAMRDGRKVKIQFGEISQATSQKSAYAPA